MPDISGTWAWDPMTFLCTKPSITYSAAVTLLVGMIVLEKKGKKDFRSLFPIKSRALDEPHPWAGLCWTFVLWEAAQGRLL